MVTLFWLLVWFALFVVYVLREVLVVVLEWVAAIAILIVLARLESIF